MVSDYYPYCGRSRWCMSYLSNLSWESSPWCRLGILAPFRLRQVQKVRLRLKTCATSTIRAGTPTLRQEREMAAGCGTPIRGPWAGLETCELPPDGGASAVAALWPRSGAAQACASCAVRPGAVAGRAHHGPSGACAGRGREIKWGCWLGGIRPQQRRYPAAIPGPPIVTKEASIQARAFFMGWRGPGRARARRRGQGGRGRALQWRAAAEGVGV